MVYRVMKSAATLLLAAFALPSCSAFLPPHSKSEWLNESHVEIIMVTFDDINKDDALLERSIKQFKDDYRAAFGPSKGDLIAHTENLATGTTTQGVGGATAVVGLVAGAAIDYVKGSIDEEAKKYEAQFSRTVAGDGFWKIENHIATQRYAGFLVRRTLLDDTEGKPAFECAFGFGPSKDKQLFRVEPLSFITRRAKAKVLSDSLLWNLLPTTWFRYLAGTAGNTIDSEVSVEIDGYYRGKDLEVHIAKCASVQWTIASYSLDSSTLLRRAPAAEAEKTIKATDSGWCAGVPLSQAPSGGVLGNGEGGAFLLKVSVTERDTSNAKQYLEKASKLVADNKDRVLKLVVQDTAVGAQQSAGTMHVQPAARENH